MISIESIVDMPITSRAEGEAFIRQLGELGLLHHFDDGAVDCLHGNGLVTLEDAKIIDRKVMETYMAWEKSGADLMNDCPIGHVIKVLEELEGE